MACYFQAILWVIVFKTKHFPSSLLQFSSLDTVDKWHPLRSTGVCPFKALHQMNHRQQRERGISQTHCIYAGQYKYDVKKDLSVTL